MRYIVTKGDLGWRIYDRKKKDYVKNSVGMVRWFATKQSAQATLSKLP